MGVWLAVAGSSLNRAHFAAGTAAAFARNGMCVSMLELCDSLPNIGYYFGMEPAAYLAPASDRRALVSGIWNGSVRYCASANLASFTRYRREPLPSGVPHAFVAAFPCPREPDEARLRAALPIATAAVDDGGLGPGRAPDAIIAAGCGGSAGRARAFSTGMREAFPGAVIVLVTDDPGSCRGSDADENLIVPGDLRVSWARRMPPADQFFGDLVSGLLLVVSQHRRKGMSHAASA